jgi:protein-tyrosine-phosphatase
MPDAVDPITHYKIRREAERLHDEFRGIFSTETIERYIAESTDELSGSRISEFVQVMNELGVDMSQEFPKPLTDEFVNAADVVITMGCGDACPIYPGKRYEDWEVEDPAGRSVDEVRTIRDDLDNHVRRLFAELTAAKVPKA